MAIKIVCDRCGFEEESSNKIKKVSLSTSSVMEVQRGNDTKMTTRDFCVSCLLDIDTYFKRRIPLHLPAPEPPPMMTEPAVSAPLTAVAPMPKYQK